MMKVQAVISIFFLGFAILMPIYAQESGNHSQSELPDHSQGLQANTVSSPVKLTSEEQAWLKQHPVIQMGIRNDWPQFTTIIHDAIDAIPNAKRNSFNSRWVPLVQNKPFDLSLIWKTGVGVVLLILLILVWNRRLSIVVKNRTMALDVSAEKFWTVYQYSRDAIVVSSTERFIDCNEAALKLFGYTSKEEFCMNHPADVSPELQPDGIPSQQKADELLDEGLKGKGETFEWIHRRKDGTDFPTEILLSPMNWDGQEVVFAVIRDVSERKKADEERFETLSRFQGFAMASQYGMGMADLEGRIIYVNPTLVKMLGENSIEDCIGKHFPSTYYPPHLAGKLEGEVMPELLKNGSWHGELELLTRDGRTLPTDENYFVINDEEGKPRYFADILTDITERKEAENALLESERKLHAIFDHHFQLTGLIDPDGRLRAANRTALRFAGVEESEVLGIYFWEGPWWEESQRGEVKRAFEKAVKGEFIRFETTHPNKENKIISIDFSFNPVKDENGKVIYIVPEGRDISMIRRAEEAMWESEIRLRNLSNNLPGGMTYQLDMGKDGKMRKFIYVGAGIEALHELTPEEAMNDSGLLYSQVLEEDVSMLIEMEKEALESMKAFIVEARFKLPSGKLEWHLLSSAPRIAPNGHIIWDGIEMDITERKKAEQKLEEYRQHLEKMVAERTEELEATIQQLKDAQAHLIQTEKMASLGVLTAGVAHEINNPLNFIMGSYFGLEKLLGKYSETDQKISDLLRSLKTGIDRAAQIVKSLNEFSRMQDRMDENCDIHSIIDNCLLMLSSELREDVVIQKEYAKDPIQCLGNVGKLQQVFINILINALHAIEHEGTIWIRTGRKKEFIEIYISDSGSGISKEVLPQILDPFFTTKDPGKGTGLGLSISYTIITEHKGTIDFESEINKGTTVKISLPIK